MDTLWLAKTGNPTIACVFKVAKLYGKAMKSDESWGRQCSSWWDFVAKVPPVWSPWLTISKFDQYFSKGGQNIRTDSLSETLRHDRLFMYPLEQHAVNF